MATKITVKTSSYNQRRYGKPWIATVDFSQTPKGEYKWGDWVGDHNSGSDGLLVIEADEGDIIARGQKDFRQPKNNVPAYYQVRNGERIKLTGKAEAYQLATAEKEQ
jgi:hypothetical protein